MAGTDSTSSGSAHHKLVREALADMDALTELTTALRGDLDSYLADVEKSRRNIAGGGRASDMPTLFDVPVVRASLSDSLNAIERARARSRRSLWRL